QDTDGFPSVARGAATPAGVAAFPWNRRQLCRGISGSFRLESVASLLWNQWQLLCGTGGRFAVESVARLPRSWGPACPWNTQVMLAIRIHATVSQKQTRYQGD